MYLDFFVGAAIAAFCRCRVVWVLDFEVVSLALNFHGGSNGTRKGFIQFIVVSETEKQKERNGDDILE